MADRDSNAGKTILWVVIAAIVIFIILLLLGIIDFDSEGEFEAPEVDVEATGGELPDLDVDTADIDVGTEPATVEVPDVDVDTEEVDVDLPTIDVDEADADEGR